MRATGLQTGRLSSQFAGLAGSIAGVHPVVGNLASVLGNFAVGGAVTAGVLLGVAAIAVAWDKLTDSTRKAKEEQDKLIVALEKVIHLKGLGPGGETVEQTAAAQARADALKVQIERMQELIVKDAMDADVIASNLVIQEKINRLLIERQNALNTAAGGRSIVTGVENAAIQAAAEEKARKAKEAADKLAIAMKKAADFAERYAMFMYEASKWTANISGVTLAGLTLMDAQKRLGIEGGQLQFGPADDFSMPNIAMPLEGLDKRQKEQLRALGILTDKADANAQLIASAVSQSAQIIGSIVVNALNIGGGGRGSQIAGSIGAIVGGAAGSMLGPPGAIITSALGGAIGSVIGGLAGSLFGGLFDSHKKEVNANTQALRQNTAALLLNAPSGFKINQARYNATDVSNLGRDLRRYGSRGGINPLLVGT